MDVNNSVMMELSTALDDILELTFSSGFFFFLKIGTEGGACVRFFSFKLIIIIIINF